MKSCFVAVFAIVSVVSLATSERAEAISYSLVVNDSVTVPTTSNGAMIPDFGVGVYDYPTSSTTNVFRSPWQNTAYDGLEYTSVRSGTAGYNLTGTVLSLFWGSVDPYNSLTFFTGAYGTGDSVSVLISELGPPLTFGHHLVQFITNVPFQSVALGSTRPGFEFANLTATPIPPALLLFLTGLGTMGLLGRRSRKHAIA
jgi:hypothetical protein